MDPDVTERKQIPAQTLSLHVNMLMIPPCIHVSCVHPNYFYMLLDVFSDLVLHTRVTNPIAGRFYLNVIAK